MFSYLRPFPWEQRLKPIMKKVEDKDKQYGDFRPWLLEPHYCRHISHMTSECLHEKSDIAIQLAYRDKMIESLGKIINRAMAAGQMEKLHDAMHLLRSFESKLWPEHWPNWPTEP